MMKKSKKGLSITLASMALMLVMSGCGASATEDNNAVNNAAVQADGNGAQQGWPGQMGERYQGQITAIEGNTLTIALADMAGRGMPEGMERPEGGERPEEMERPDGDERPEGMGMPNDGEMPEGAERPQGAQRGQGMPQMELTLSGETKAIEITDSTTIAINGEQASIEDLAVDDIVMISMDGDTVLSVMVMKMDAQMQ